MTEETKKKRGSEEIIEPIALRKSTRTTVNKAQELQQQQQKQEVKKPAPSPKNSVKIKY